MKKWGTNQKRTSNELKNDLKKEPALIIMINAMLLRVLSCKALLPWLSKVHHKSPSILPADREWKISSVYFMWMLPKFLIYILPSARRSSRWKFPIRTRLTGQMLQRIRDKIRIF